MIAGAISFIANKFVAGFRRPEAQAETPGAGLYAVSYEL